MAPFKFNSPEHVRNVVQMHRYPTIIRSTDMRDLTETILTLGKELGTNWFIFTIKMPDGKKQDVPEMHFSPPEEPCAYVVFSVEQILNTVINIRDLIDKGQFKNHECVAIHNFRGTNVLGFENNVYSETLTASYTETLSKFITMVPVWDFLFNVWYEIEQMLYFDNLKKGINTRGQIATLTSPEQFL